MKPNNTEVARTQMLGQQIRAWDVLDERVLGVLRRTPREDFVPSRYRDLAFADIEVPLDHGEKMMAPKIEARLLQSLAIEPIDDVLEIGTGSGYLTACLSRLASTVASVDIYGSFTDEAGGKLASHGISNVQLSTADAFALRHVEAFDVIAVTGSVPRLTEHFIGMLRPNGRLFIVVGRAPVMEALSIVKRSDGTWVQESLFETVVAPLVNSETAEPFVL